MFFSANSSNEVQWKMLSQDSEFVKALFVTKSRKRTLVRKEVNNDNDGDHSGDESCDSEEVSSEDSLSDNEENDDNSEEV